MTDPRGQDLITRDTACRGCGFNLRALPVEGDCPECGLAISESRHEPWLVYAGSAWVRRLVFGLDLLMAGALTGMVIWAFVAFYKPDHGVLTETLKAFGPALIGVGGWLFTQPCASEHLSRWDEWVRLIARAASAGTTAYAVAGGMAGTHGLGWPDPDLTPLVAAAGLFALLGYASVIAKRIPANGLRHHLLLVMSVLPVQLGVLTVVSIAEVGFACCLLAISVPIWLAWTAVILSAFRTELAWDGRAADEVL